LVSDREDDGEFLPQFDPAGLLPVIVQHVDTGAVLMMAYMNQEALGRTLVTGEAHFWSRSRQALWRKGEVSGEVQQVVEVLIDCDQDTLLLKVRPGGKGAACHTGRRSCFYRRIDIPSLGLRSIEDERLFDPGAVYADK
jgi:phosphoribosyl-AMP cyclohydrolase